VGVAFIEPIKNDVIKDRDIRYETMRASGPGGQNVNKVETAVRATYVPTGLSVVASDNRSQTLNKKLAYERLLAKLSAIEDEKHSEQERAVWMNHNLLERGNAVQTFKGEL
jgi:peptide chain release factor